MKTIKEIKAIGFKDGAEAARESGTAATPVNGWDGDLINAIGGTKTAELFGLKKCEGANWDKALIAYSEGCAEGAKAQVAELA